MPRNSIYAPESHLQLPIRFADLRRLAREVPAYMADLVGVADEPWSLRTAVEDEWGVYGMDTYELLVAFGEKYQVDMTRFDFTSFISPEGMNLRQGFLATVLLFLWLMKTALAGLCWPFSPKCATAIWQFSLSKALAPTKPQPLAEVLTTGDFVASAAAGHFVKHERIRFVLVKSAISE